MWWELSWPVRAFVVVGVVVTVITKLMALGADMV